MSPSPEPAFSRLGPARPPPPACRCWPPVPLRRQVRWKTGWPSCFSSGTTTIRLVLSPNLKTIYARVNDLEETDPQLQEIFRMKGLLFKQKEEVVEKTAPEKAAEAAAKKKGRARGGHSSAQQLVVTKFEHTHTKYLSPEARFQRPSKRPRRVPIRTEVLPLAGDSRAGLDLAAGRRVPEHPGRSLEGHLALGEHPTAGPAAAAAVQVPEALPAGVRPAMAAAG